MNGACINREAGISSIELAVPVKTDERGKNPRCTGHPGIVNPFKFSLDSRPWYRAYIVSKSGFITTISWFLKNKLPYKRDDNEKNYITANDTDKCYYTERLWSGRHYKDHTAR
jgi:hypothetical protein